MQGDVEGLESEVLQGVGAAAWPRVRQVAAEVHDAGGRAAAVEALLRSAGFPHVARARGAAPRTTMVAAWR